MDLEGFASLMLDEFAHMRAEMREHTERFRALEKGQGEILARLAPLERAFDKDSVMLQSHEKRITHVERVCLK